MSMGNGCIEVCHLLEYRVVVVNKMWATVVHEQHNCGMDRVLPQPEGVRGEILSGNGQLCQTCEYGCDARKSRLERGALIVYSKDPGIDFVC